MVNLTRKLILAVLWLAVIAIFTCAVPFILIFWTLRGAFIGYRNGTYFAARGYRKSTQVFTSTWKLWDSL